MEHLSNIFFISTWSFAISPTTAHYCVWGLCESSEYCCDENVCCSYKDYNIWITVVIIAGVVIGMIMAGTCLYYNLCRIYLYLQRRYYGISSVSMPSEFDSDGKSIRISFQE
ncbi:uncharacterized protein LOC105206259 [Solenopsis invicta]|uniref:uncharacterized protein LOC105206259 n=1 Tax=Solenopsis invicta TaxID=13686 RepID=UPI000595F7BE|nr:uncharacterized protein LOC105206259 [Solenopsis invicta]